MRLTEQNVTMCEVRATKLSPAFNMGHSGIYQLRMAIVALRRVPNILIVGSGRNQIFSEMLYANMREGLPLYSRTQGMLAGNKQNQG